MAQYRITGGAQLSGELTISGRKNAALKLIAASLLSSQLTTLTNIPDIGDVRVMIQILEEMGAEIEKKGDTLIISTKNVSSPIIPQDLSSKLRASLVLAGPLLARFGKVSFAHPGGDQIGVRSITPHLEGFKKLGATVEKEGNTYSLTAPKLIGTTIYLWEATVTGTENIIMAACGAEGITTLYNAAQEPHIANLCQLLCSMGYEITGENTSTLQITGGSLSTTKPAQTEVIPDDLEVGTFAAAALITKGDILLRKVGTYYMLMPLLAMLDALHAVYEYNAEAQTLHLLPSHELQATTIRPQPWPGFSTDLGSVFAIVATQATGTTLIHEWMFEGRLSFLELVKSMGANVILADPHRAFIKGPTRLRSHSVITPDIRAGAALILAAIIAKGRSTVEHIEVIERGYDKIDQKLNSLGANIIRED